MKVYIETLGCSKNTVDSENAAALLEGNSHIIVDNPESAEAVIVNTCAFIKDAKIESVDTILEMAEIKKDKELLLIVSGCLSQRYIEELYNEIPEVDIFIGVNEYNKINEILKSHESGLRIKTISEAPETFDEIPVRRTERGVASEYLKISEGCSNACSYCSIPSIRGAYRSRRRENIIAEAEMLAARGIREINIIAQDVTAYGFDLYGGYVLHELLRDLCKIDGIHWIRLLYCYEDSITDELIKTIAEEKKICNYLDIPLQHVNDRVLYDMNRNSTSKSINGTINRIRSMIPDVHIRTTFITGFPGESDAEFSELADFVEKTEFNRMGVFSYSLEENTVAADMKNQVDDEIKEIRRDSLMQIQREISLKLNESKIGRIFEVFVEEALEDETYNGRTEFDAPEIDNGVIFTSEHVLEPGTFVNVEITDAFDYDLVGKAVE